MARPTAENNATCAEMMRCGIIILRWYAQGDLKSPAPPRGGNTGAEVKVIVKRQRKRKSIAAIEDVIALSFGLGRTCVGSEFVEEVVRPCDVESVPVVTNDKFGVAALP